MVFTKAPTVLGLGWGVVIQVRCQSAHNKFLEGLHWLSFGGTKAICESMSIGVPAPFGVRATLQ